MKRETRILPVGLGAFKAKFYGNGVIPCQNVDAVRWVVNRATTLMPEGFRHWNVAAEF